MPASAEDEEAPAAMPASLEEEEECVGKRTRKSWRTEDQEDIYTIYIYKVDETEVEKSFWLSRPPRHLRCCCRLPSSLSLVRVVAPQ